MEEDNILVATLRQITAQLEQLQTLRAPDHDIIANIGPIANELGISYQHCRNALISGEIPARRLGQTWLASRAVLRAWAGGGASNSELRGATGTGPGRPRKQKGQGRSL